MDEITRFFSDDHRRCDELFVALEKAVTQGDWADATSVGRRFIGDMEHHMAMEENELFPLLAGVSSGAGGPIHVMRMEHQQMRQLFAQLATALEGRDTQACLDVTETLLMVMQQHHAKEENILYPMADQALGAAAERLVRRLQQAA
jgi:iron-sulfur cluster repair protein YtfE (RIC family)